MHIQRASAILTLALLTGCQSAPKQPAIASASQIKTSAAPAAHSDTLSSFSLSSGTNAPIDRRMINLEEADLKMVLELYELISRRTVIRSPQVQANVKITLRNTEPMTAVEALQAFDTTLAMNGIAMVYAGTQYVKVVPAAACGPEGPPIIDRPWRLLPQSSSPLTYITKLKFLPAERATSLLQPFAQLPNSIIGLKGSDVLILRDYSSNVRRMMEVLERLDTANSQELPPTRVK